MIKKYLRRPFHSPDYEIISDCNKLIETLQMQYGSYLSGVKCGNPYSISITETGKSDGEYIFEHGVKKSVTDAPLRVLDDILFDMTKYDDNIIPLHGASVEYNGYAYVFLAPTTSGKTTLTAYLISGGFNYITEDGILIDKKTFGVYPYPCPVHIRSGGFEVLKNHGIAIPNIKHLETHSGTRYIYNPDNCVKTLTPLGMIFFITRSETENNVINMTVSENIISLMKSAIADYRPSGEHIRLMTALAKNKCRRLIYRDMDYVKDIIMKGGE